MSRQLGDERDRYGRKSIREQLDDLLAWPAAHRIATGVILAFIVVGLLVSATRGLKVAPGDLAVGDCLFVRTSSSQSDDHPIGEPDEVAVELLAGNAERAGCDASHGHEVSALVDLTQLRDTLSEAAARCTARFEPYVGRSLAGSAYTTFAALPTPVEQSRGAHLGVCLIARGDGEWMAHQARASGE